MAERIFIFGASGSGTSTLGAALAARFGYRHLDSDSFFWEPTDPPFQQKREVAQRQHQLQQALDAQPRWVLSGCLHGWGDMFIPRFESVIFLSLPQEVRMARLRARELSRYGAEALAPGGAMFEQHTAFMRWAEAYEQADVSMRSRRRHEAWIAALPCPVTRLDATRSVEQHIEDLAVQLGLE